MVGLSHIHHRACLKVILLGYAISEYCSLFRRNFWQFWPIGSSGGHEGRFSRDLLPVFSAGGPFEQFWHGQICPIFDVVHPSPTVQRVLKDGFGEVVVAYPNHTSFLFWQLPEEVPVDVQESWSCSAPSRWSCAPSKRYGKVSSRTWSRKPGSFSQSQQAGSMFHSRSTCRAWTCLQNRWCCTARFCLVWPLLRQSWFGLLPSRCRLCTGLLPVTWNQVKSSYIRFFPSIDEITSVRQRSFPRF